MAAVKRTDSKGRNLRDRESQMQDGRYRYQYIDQTGKRCTIFSWKLVPTDKVPSGKRDCISLREKIKQIEKDMNDGIRSADSNRITVNDMFDKYIATKTELKNSTRSNYIYIFDNYVRTTPFGNKKLSAVKYSDILKFYTYLINEKQFKPNSMEVVHTILHPTFNMALRDGLVRCNPTDGAMAEIKKSHNWEKPKRHALTEEEQSAFITYMANSDIYQHWLPLFTTFLGTGCRIGEIIGLRWDDVDFKNQTININHNLIYRQYNNENCEMHITTPKTSAGCRTIPMLSEVKKALLEERAKSFSSGGCKAEIDGYTNFIFCNRYGNVHNPMTINRAIERIRLAYNAEETENAKKEKRDPVLIRHFSAHNLRHTFCTRFCENETNVKVIQEIMGHSDISTTMNIYAEATENKKKECFNNLEGKIKIS